MTELLMNTELLNINSFDEAEQAAQLFINWLTEHEQLDKKLPNGKIDVEFYLLAPFDNWLAIQKIHNGSGGFADAISREVLCLLDDM